MKKFLIILIVLFLGNSAMGQWSPNYSDTANSSSSYHPAIFFSNVDTGYVVAGSGIWKTTDGGVNWNVQAIEQVAGLNSVYFVNSNIGYAGTCGHNSGWPTLYRRILKTTDGGFSWTIQNYEQGGLYSLFFTDVNTGYAVGCDANSPPNPTIMKTTDGGLNWTTQMVLSPYTGELMSVFFVDAMTGYVAGGHSYGPPARFILKTTDGGSNWNVILNEDGWELESIFFHNANTGYSVGSFGTILKSNDGGINWVELSSNTNLDLHSVYFTDVNTGYAVGGLAYSENIILKTSNGGLTWYEQTITGTEFNGELSSVFFPAVDIGYIAGIRADSIVGTFLFKTENGGGFPVGLTDQRNNSINLSIKPNPVTTSINIKCHEKGTLFILNLGGVELMRQKITVPTTTVDVSTLPSGIYVVKVVDEKGVQVGKFVKQ